MGLTLLLTKATCVLSVGLLLAAALRRRPAALRHSLLVACVLGAALVPAVSVVTPVRFRIPNVSLAAAPSVTVEEVVTLPLGARSSVAAPRTDVRGLTLQGIALTLWAAVSLLAMVRLAKDLWQLRALRLHSAPCRDERWNACVSALSASLGVPRPVTLRVGDASAPVVTWGLRMPHLLVPASAVSWSDRQMQVVLTHELSHVARRDWLWIVLMELARVAYGWHPLMWLAIRQARRAGEHACDDVVLRHEALPSTYAQVLLDLARSTRAPRSSVVTAITHDSFLERRISTMLDSTIDHSAVRPRTRWLAVTSLMVASLAVASAGAHTRKSGTGTIVATVRPNGGLPLADVSVTLTGGPQDIRAQTDVNGSFSIDVPAGTYRAAIRVPGFKRFESLVDVTAGERVTRDFGLALSGLSETIHVAGETDPGATPVNLNPDTPITRSIGVITTPRKLTNSAPDYPVALRAAGIGGVVKVSARIGVDGHTSDVTVLQSPHPELAQLVVEHVARWRYEPTRVQDVPVATDVTVTFDFQAARQP